MADVTVPYSSSAADFPNPERGFHELLISHPSQWIPDAEWFDNKRANNYRTLYGLILGLDDFKSAPISPEWLADFEARLIRLREVGAKCFVRAWYLYDDSGDDTTLAQMLAHIDQLAPYWNAYADVISYHQAGFVGSWGEWAYSDNFGNTDGVTPSYGLTPQNWADRKAIVDKLLQVIPSTQFVTLRTPNFKRQMYGTGQLNNTSAFNGSANARLGFFNDAFMSSPTDMGTFLNESQSEYSYLANETKYTPMGGESAAYVPPRSDAVAAQVELALFHFSHLNEGYFPDTIDAWKTAGAFDTIRAKLGYRLELVSATFRNSAAQGAGMPVSLTLRNVGYAAPFNARPVYLVLRNTASPFSVTSIPLNVDCRTWLPGSDITVTATVQIPATLPVGSYTLALHLPDAAPSIATNSRYAIRFANSGVWEESTGYNLLNHTLAIASASTPTTTPSASSFSLMAVPAIASFSVGAIEAPTTFYLQFGGGIVWGGAVENGVLKALPASGFFLEDDTSRFFDGWDGSTFWRSDTFRAMRYQTDTFTPSLAAVGSQMTLDADISGETIRIDYRSAPLALMFPGDDAAPFWNVDDSAPFFVDPFYGDVPFVTWPGQITAKNHQYQFQFYVGGGPTQGIIDRCSVIIDAPDIVEIFNDVLIAAGGSWVVPTKNFSAIKNAQVTLQADGGTAVRVKVLQKSETQGVRLQCFDAAGNGTSGTVDVVVQGY